MNRITSLILLFLGASQTWALDEPKGIAHTVNQDRRLQFLGLPPIGSCKSQLETCQATARASKLPYTEWSQILERLNEDDNGLFNDLNHLVGTFSKVNFLSSAKDTSPVPRAVNSTELEEMFEPLEQVEIGEGTEVTLNQVGVVVSLIERVARFLEVSFDFTFIKDLAGVIDKVIAAQEDGALYVWGNIAAALVRYTLPFILNLIQSTVDPLICAEVMDCQFSQMASKVLPAMVEGAFDAMKHSP